MLLVVLLSPHLLLGWAGRGDQGAEGESKERFMQFRNPFVGASGPILLDRKQMQ